MYHTIVRRKVVGIFQALGRGDYEVALAGLAPRFEHVFAGTHALGGQRHTAAAMRNWFQRLFRLLPHLAFNVKHIAVSGPPWGPPRHGNPSSRLPQDGGRGHRRSGGRSDSGLRQMRNP